MEPLVETPSAPVEAPVAPHDGGEVPMTPVPAPVEAAPVAAEKATASVGGEDTAAPVEAHTTVSALPVKMYPSLYDTKATTVVAIVFGIVIIGGIQYMVHRMFAATKNEHKALTQFVTSMVALVIGAYLCDLIVSGPATSLMTTHEHDTILSFTKDTCLMVFAYYFGTKAGPTPPDSE